MTETYFTTFLKHGIAATQCLENDNVPLDPKLAEIVSAESQLLNCVYWCVTGLTMLGCQLAELRDAVERFYRDCQRENGFAQSSRQGAHLLATVSGVQIARLLHLTPPPFRDSVLSLRTENGAFVAYEGGEEDVRFVYAAILCLHLIGSELPDCSPTVAWLRSCQNVDGGFGSTPKAESHAGHTFCALAALALLNQKLEGRSWARCCRWLLSRQVESSGLNGRTGKSADSCYTFWVLASARIVGLGVEGFEVTALRAFLESCKKEGGIAKDADCCPDPFHSFFALAGEKLLDGDEFDPVTALPVGVLDS